MPLGWLLHLGAPRCALSHPQGSEWEQNCQGCPEAFILLNLLPLFLKMFWKWFLLSSFPSLKVCPASPVVTAATEPPFIDNPAHHWLCGCHVKAHEGPDPEKPLDTSPRAGHGIPQGIHGSWWDQAVSTLIFHRDLFSALNLPQLCSHLSEAAASPEPFPRCSRCSRVTARGSNPSAGLWQHLGEARAEIRQVFVGSAPCSAFRCQNGREGAGAAQRELNRHKRGSVLSTPGS